ncbi:MAG: DUF1427 family protein [Firmicutes bacterium]|nr:DUF1427 family protein [Bacillota bacterium]
MWRDLVLALVAGAAAGFLFGKLKLPVPAPPTLAGILGIVGLTLGYTLARHF